MWSGFVLMLALVGIGGAGCAVPNAPVALYPPSPTTHPSFTDVGVMRFQDLRPKEQREGKRPRLVPLIVWNQRIGDYVTGEEAFTNAAEQIRDTIAGN